MTVTNLKACWKTRFCHYHKATNWKKWQNAWGQLVGGQISTLEPPEYDATVTLTTSRRWGGYRHSVSQTKSLTFKCRWREATEQTVST